LFQVTPSLPGDELAILIDCLVRSAELGATDRPTD
jgi:hypothetical protein